MTSILVCSTTAVALLGCFLGCGDIRGSGADDRKIAAVTVSGSRLAIGGKERWLLGASLFDALGATPVSDADLDALVDWRISIVRVWAHWSAPIYDAQGALHADGEARLHRLMDRLSARGLVLEFVLLRPGQLPGERFPAFASPEARIRAVREIARSLRPYRNALFDVYNEHDHPHGPISHRDLRVLRDAVKEIDPDRLVTVSSTEYHFLNPQSAIEDSGRAHLRDEAGMHDGAVGVDLIAVHPPGTPDWAEATAGRIRTLRQAMRELGREVPIYFNEGPRARPGEPRILPERYVIAADATRQAGAAGWVFHTAAGYALAERAFVAALTADERQALRQLEALSDSAEPKP